jgi:hypothetical protein
MFGCLKRALGVFTREPRPSGASRRVQYHGRQGALARSVDPFRFGEVARLIGAGFRLTEP